MQGGPNPATASMAMCYHYESQSKVGRVLLHGDSQPVHGADEVRAWADKGREKHARSYRLIQALGCKDFCGTDLGPGD